MTQKERVLYLLPEKKKEQIIDAAQLGVFFVSHWSGFSKTSGRKTIARNGFVWEGKMRDFTTSTV